MIEFDGSEIDDLARDLDGAERRVVERAGLVIAKSGHDAVRNMQGLARVDTGAMRASTSVDVDGDGLGFAAGPTVSYAPYNEYGTSRMSPQPFVIPGFEMVLPAAYEALEQIAESSALG